MKKNDLILEKDKLTPAQIAKDVVVFFANMAVLFGIYIGGIYLNSLVGGEAFESYFSGGNDGFFYLVLATVLFSAILAVCLYFENPRFFAEAKNLEMLFLMMELTLVLSDVFGRYISVYLRPIPLMAILTVQFFGKRFAVYLKQKKMQMKQKKMQTL